MTRSTWTPTRFYPAEGDSAIFELEHSSGLFLEMWLEGINLATEGTARITSARVMVHVHGTDRTGSVELDELTAHLAEGRQWLLDNEQGRFRNPTSQHRRLAGHAACPRYSCLSPALRLLLLVRCAAGPGLAVAMASALKR